MRILAAGVLALLVLPAQAKEGDTFRPFVSAGYFYDSNLFRLADDQSPGFPRDDHYGIFSAGVDVDWKPGRQQIVANATKTLVRYDRYTPFDFDGADYKATWNWRLGNRLSGNLGASQSLSQSNFDSVGQVNNEVDRQRYFGRAEWEFHPRWRIGGGVDETDNTNSASSEISNDYQRRVLDVMLGYRTPKGSDLRAQVRKIDAEFPNPEIATYACPLPGFCLVTEVADNSYEQTEYNLLGDWRVSGKLTLRGQAGWVDRKYENVLRGNLAGPPTLILRPDFDGFSGRLSADWYATGKTLVSASVYRELGGAGDINAVSVLKSGGSLNGVWLMHEKWRLSAGGTFENRDFEGDPKQRNDDTSSASLSLNYMPVRDVSVDFGMRAGRRDSNINDDDYDFHSFFVNVRGDF